MARPSRVLLVRLDHMGDVVLTVPPVVHSLRATYPDLEIHVLTTRIGRRLLAPDPAITCILEFDPPWSVREEDQARTMSKLAWFLRCSGFLRAHGFRGPADYDWLVFLSSSPWERILTRFWSAQRLGFSNVYSRLAFRASNHLLTHRLPFDASSHSTDNAL